MRQGLFQYGHNPANAVSSSTKFTKFIKRQQKQKSRSGRIIKTTIVNNSVLSNEHIYIAHTLLNVHNLNPLIPFKLGQSKKEMTSNALQQSTHNVTSIEGGLKLRKLLKPASGRSARKRIEKLRHQLKREQQIVMTSPIS